MDFDRWYERPAYVAVIAFLAGAAITAIIFLLVGNGGGDGDAPEPTAQLPATPTITAVPLGATVVPGAATAVPAVTETPPADGTPSAAQDPDEALAAFVLSEFGSEFIGECPTEPEGAPEGICGSELYRSDELVTFALGPPFSEVIGEAVLTPDADGNWVVNFLPAPPLGGPGLAVGAQAVVYQVGNCLNFRAEASTGADVRSCQIDGTTGPVVEGPIEADGVVWWHLEALGWASEEFLVPTG